VRLDGILEKRIPHPRILAEIRKITVKSKKLDGRAVPIVPPSAATNNDATVETTSLVPVTRLAADGVVPEKLGRWKWSMPRRRPAGIRE
jgi:hypothetical protein